MALHTLTQIKNANERRGHRWFSPDTMRWFNSRVSSTVYPVPDGAVFVSSERRWDDTRRYTVRYCSDDGVIDTVGEFGTFASRSGAHAAARRHQAALRAATPATPATPATSVD